MRKLRWTTQALGLAIANLGFIPALKLGVCAPVFYCHGCPAAAFACPIGAMQTGAALGPMPFFLMGLLILFGVTLGRFWCGWACPFGTVQDILAKLGRKKDIVQVRPVPALKYVVLGVILVLAWASADVLFCKVCPSGSLFAAIPQRFTSQDLLWGPFFWVHIGTLAAAIVAFVLVGRFWCRFLCPLGAWYGVFNRVSILGVCRDEGKCNLCLSCLAACPAKLTAVEQVGTSTDCTRCGTCVEACTTGALKIRAALYPGRQQAGSCQGQ